MADRSGPIFLCKVVIGKGPAQRVADDVKIIDWEFEELEGAVTTPTAPNGAPGGSDKLKLTVDNFDLSNFDNPIWADGNVIQFQFGYAGNMSPQREAIITKVTGFVSLKVEALGRTVQLNRIPKTRVFQNMKRSDVVKQIANDNHFPTVDIDDTSETIAQVTQSRMTDMALCRDLAMREGFQFYVDQTGLHFHARRFGQKPIRQLWYYTGGDGDIKSYPEIKSDITARPAAVVAKGRDALNKTPMVATASNTGDTGRPGLAPVVSADLTVNKQTGEITPNTSAPNVGAHVIATTERTQESAQRHATGVYQNAQSGAFLMTVPCVGDPSITAKAVVQLLGLGKTVSGNYYITKATHRRKGDYETVIEVRRDGRSSALGVGSTSKAQVNSQAGPKEVSDQLVEKKVVDKVTGEVRTIFVDGRGSQS